MNNIIGYTVYELCGTYCVQWYSDVHNTAILKFYVANIEQRTDMVFLDDVIVLLKNFLNHFYLFTVFSNHTFSELISGCPL